MQQVRGLTYFAVKWPLTWAVLVDILRQRTETYLSALFGH